MVFGLGDSGVINVTPLFGKSRLFQLTNLNGEPVFRDIPLNVNESQATTCNLTYIGREVRYFKLLNEDLGGEYELKMVVEDSEGRKSQG